MSVEAEIVKRLSNPSWLPGLPGLLEELLNGRQSHEQNEHHDEQDEDHAVDAEKTLAQSRILQEKRCIRELWKRRPER